MPLVLEFWRYIISIKIAEVNSSDAHPDVVDMCSNSSRISEGFYLTSSGFPAGFNGTGSCECRAESVDSNMFAATVDMLHVVLPDEEICNEELLISKDYGWYEEIASDCSPYQMIPHRYISNLRGIKVFFHRKRPTESNKKTVVWIGIGGKYWHWRFSKHSWCYGENCTLVDTELFIHLLLNTLRPRQNGRHFTDDILKGIFVNENVRISIKMSLKFVPKGTINNIPVLVQIITWHRPGDKPSSKNNDGLFTDAYMCHSVSMSFKLTMSQPTNEGAMCNSHHFNSYRFKPCNVHHF